MSASNGVLQDDSAGPGRVTWRIDIRPEPTADERDAVVAALAVLGRRRPEAPIAPRGRWAMAARREQLRGSLSRWGDR